MTPRVAVLDYEMSNLRSAVKALERLGNDVDVVLEPAGARGADAVVLPGVGHFGEAMRRIRRRGLDGAVVEAVERGAPVLGLCLGRQLLFDVSDEAPGVAGLGLIPGSVRRLRTRRKLPQMGWNEVAWAPGPLAPPGDVRGDATYYFVHAYAARPDDPDAVLGTAEYGERFFFKGNLDAVNEMLGADDETFEQAVKQRISVGKPRSGYILSSACSVAPHVKPERLKRLTELSAQFGEY